MNASREEKNKKEAVQGFINKVGELLVKKLDRCELKDAPNDQLELPPMFSDEAKEATPESVQEALTSVEPVKLKKKQKIVTGFVGADGVERHFTANDLRHMLGYYKPEEVRQTSKTFIGLFNEKAGKVIDKPFIPFEREALIEAKKEGSWNKGTFYKEAILREMTDRLGLSEITHKNEKYIHYHNKFMIHYIDGITTFEGDEVVLNVEMVSDRDPDKEAYGTSNNPDLPYWINAKSQVLMSLTGLKKCVVIVALGFNEVRHYVVHENLGELFFIEECYKDFFQRLKDNKCPEPIYDERLTANQNKALKRNAVINLKGVATPTLEADEACQAIKHQKVERQQFENVIINAMADDRFYLSRSCGIGFEKAKNGRTKTGRLLTERSISDIEKILEKEGIPYETSEE